jgi:hypothetical protein
LKVRIHGLPLDEIRMLLNANFASAVENAKSFSVIEQQVDPTPLPNVMAGEIPWGTVMRQKLTKKLLNSCLRALTLFSTATLGEEIFWEHLGAPETRDTTWKRAVIAGANNQLCRLLWTEEDFNGPDFLRQGPRASPR